MRPIREAEAEARRLAMKKKWEATPRRFRGLEAVKVCVMGGRHSVCRRKRRRKRRRRKKKRKRRRATRTTM